VLAHGTWARRYGGDPQVIGRAIRLNGQPYQIVGVLPEDFSLRREVLPTLGVAEDGEMFLPLPLAPSAAAVRGHEDYNIVGKLVPGVTVAQAQAEMDAITARLRHDYPGIYPPNGGLTFGIVPLLDQVVGGVRWTLLVLVGSVGFVLLIACANVANLMLSRSLDREKEMAVRVALGAGRRRIVRQLLTESLLLALLGGALGAAFSVAAVSWIQVLQPRNVPRLRDIAVNGEVLLFTLWLCALAGVLFGLAPALGVWRINVFGTLAAAGRAPTNAGALWGRGNNLRRVLVVFELALSLVLLIGAGLLIRSFRHLQDVAPGFDPRGVLTLELTMTGQRYGDAPAVRNAYRALWERLDRLPGVIASGGVTSLPLSGYFAWGPITVEGRVPLPGENFINADQRVVAGRYFQAMDIPLLRGRFFEEQDTADKPRVVIVDEYMAAQLWPNGDPLGKRIRFGDLASPGPWATVVGIVGRVKQYALDSDGRIALYFSHTQSPSRALYVAVRSRGEPAALAPSIRTEIRAIDPDLPLYHVRPMTEWVDHSLARNRFAMQLLSLFAGLALALTTVGVYGVVSYLVNQSRREIGIRMALGATERAVLRLVLRQGLAIALLGGTIGLAAALGLTRLMESLLFGVKGTDALTFATVALGLTAVTLIASYVPARRAARIDPMVSLRAE
jgi:predicted permease